MDSHQDPLFDHQWQCWATVVHYLTSSDSGKPIWSTFTPWDSIKRILSGYRPTVGQRGQQYPQLALGPVPELWPCETGTQRTLVQSPYGHVPELFLALPWRTAAGDCPTPVSCVGLPPGLDKTNFPWVPTPRWEKGATIPITRTRSRTWTLTYGKATRGTFRTTFSHMATPLVPQVSR